jgi:hypothetical protein
MGTTTPSQPGNTQSNPGDDWATGWGTNSGTSQATIDRAGNSTPIGTTARDSNLGPLQPVNGGGQEPQQAASGWADPWEGTNPWANTPQSAAGGTTPQNAANNAATVRNEAADWHLGGQLANDSSNLPVNQPPVVNGANNASRAGGLPSSAQPGLTLPSSGTQPATIPASEQPPWLPLLIVSLSLVGSLSANLFLGWSYLDARQKYRSLVRKTADTFRRAASAVA